MKTPFPLNYKEIRVCKREVTVEGIVFPAYIVSHLFLESMKLVWKFRTQKLIALQMLVASNRCWSTHWRL